MKNQVAATDGNKPSLNEQHKVKSRSKIRRLTVRIKSFNGGNILNRYIAFYCGHFLMAHIYSHGIVWLNDCGGKALKVTEDELSRAITIHHRFEEFYSK